MGTVVCYVRPDRSKPRRFTCADARRISRYAARESGPECVAREVLSELGFGEGICSLLKAALAIARVSDVVGLARILASIATLISAIMFALRPVEGVSRRIKALLVLLGAANVALNSLVELLGEFEVAAIEELQDVFCEEEGET